MSDLDEPPAKVLKIDNIDGVTNVTELSEYPPPFDGGDDMMEESGIIEGGADVAEEQEQWLSEGILTDEDYIPASQDTTGDRTDSQLGSTHEEEHLDSTLDSEALAEHGQQMEQNEQHMEETEQHIEENEHDVVSNGHDLEENEQNLSENQQDLDSKQHLTENEQKLENNAENEQNVASNEECVVINEQSLENEQHLVDNEQHLSENEQNLVENEQSLVENEQSLVESEHYENEEHLADTSMESETGNVDNEQTQMEVDTTMSLDDTQEDIQNTPTNGAESLNGSQPKTIEQLMEMSNLDANMESQTYTQANEESLDTVQSTLLKEEAQETKPVEINIEEAMKNLDGETDVKSDDFDSLLKRNTDIKKEPKIKTESKEDDGNDTDDLLRMLGEDDNKGKKKLTKTVADIRNSARAADSTDDDDDDFVYENTRIKKLKAAQSILKKKMATKAEPEDMDDDVEPTPKPVKHMPFRSGASILRHNHNKPPNVHLVQRPKTSDKPKQYQNKRLGQSLLKPISTSINAGNATTAPSSINNQGKMSFQPTVSKTSMPLRQSLLPKTVEKTNSGQARNKTDTDKGKNEPKVVEAKKPEGKISYEPVKIKTESGMIQIEPGTMKVLPEEIMQEEEFLEEEEEFPADEDEYAEFDNDTILHRQRIVRPETMEEEVPSDGDSGDEDASLYDEMPTSDSDDADDWFQLDIRCEKAGDYLPLLGPRAKELLLEEKRRVSARLSTLSQSHKALAASGKQQAGLLRRATAALAEIDDMIRAA